MSMRLVLGDDHPVVLQGVTRLLEQTEFSIVAACADGIDCLQTIRRLSPDCVLLDVSMPGMSGLDVLREIRHRKIPVRVVLFTAMINDWELELASQLKADGIILKDAGADEYLHCLAEVMAGRQWISPELMRRLNSCDSRGSVTLRERQVMSLIKQGLQNKEIARELHVTDGTVKVHLHNIYRKLGVTNRTALVAVLNRTYLSERGTDN